MLGTTGMFVFLYHLGHFLTVPPLYPDLFPPQGLSMNALLLFREAERRASGFNQEDVNYVGDRLALMGLYWHLCPNLRNFKQSRHIQFYLCFHLDQRKIIIPMSWVMMHWGQTGVNFEEHPMSLELFALPQSWFHKHRMSIRSERFYYSWDLGVQVQNPSDKGPCLVGRVCYSTGGFMNVSSIWIFLNECT